MDTTNIDCICGNSFHGLKPPVNPPKPGRWNQQDIEQYLQRRNRTIEIIHQLNNTLSPALYIRGSPTPTPGNSSQPGTYRSLYSRIDQTSQTTVTGGVKPTEVDLTGETEIHTSVAERVKRKKFVCCFCGSEYHWRSSVYRHVKNDHQLNCEVCEYCRVPFTHRDGLRTHLGDRRERGWCRIERPIRDMANKTVVRPSINYGMPDLYSSVDIRM